MSRDFRPLPTDRIEAFSDGVYAIAITLLVLDLRVPESPDRLLADLAESWPSFLGYLVSFVFIGGSWVFHVKLTRSLSASDDVFIGLNLLKLLSVSFLPFPTSVLANHLADNSQRPAAVVFGVNLTLASLMNVVLSGYAARAKAIVPIQERPELRVLFREQLLYTALLGLATIVAIFLPTPAVVLYLTLAALMFVRPFVGVERRMRGRRSPRP